MERQAGIQQGGSSMRVNRSDVDTHSRDVLQPGSWDPQTPRCIDMHPVRWQSVSGVTQHSKGDGFVDLEKTGGGNSWSYGAHSTKAFYETDMIIGVRFQCKDKHMMIGLNYNPSNYGYQEIDYAVYCHPNNFYSYESGSNVYTFTDLVDFNYDHDPEFQAVHCLAGKVC